VLLAVFPLLPSGPAYLGIQSRVLPEAAVVALLAVALIVRVVNRTPPIDRRRSASAVVLSTWTLFMAAATGAALVGLAGENRIGSPVFDAHLRELTSRFLRPLDFTVDPFYPIRVWLTLLEGFLVFLALRSCARRSPDPTRFVVICRRGYLCGLALVSSFALLQYLTRFHLHPYWIARNADLVRVHATLDDPNSLASYLVIGLGMAIGLAWSDASRRTRAAALVLAAVAIAAVVATVSRAGLVALPATALLVAAARPARRDEAAASRALPRSSRQLARLLLLAGAAATVLLLIAHAVVKRQSPPEPTNPIQAVAQMLDPRVPLEGLFKGRLALWRAAVAMAAQHPLTGVGLGRYPRLLPDFRDRWLPLDNAHNFYLQLAAETGALGALAFMATLVASIVVLIGAMQRADARGAGFALGALFGTIASALTFLTGHWLLLPSGQFLWASALALGLAGAEVGREPAANRQPAASRATVALVVLVLAAYATAAAVMAPPPHGVWGYSWGVFPEEGGVFPDRWGLPHERDFSVSLPPGFGVARFRWTGPRTIIELTAPPSASECLLQIAAALPTYGGPQYVRVLVDQASRVYVLRNSDLTTVRVPVTAGMLDDRRRFTVHLAIDPAFVPAAFGLSDDRRPLGVQWFAPRWAQLVAE
jgi:O-antigen ligase